MLNESSICWEVSFCERAIIEGVDKESKFVDNIWAVNSREDPVLTEKILFFSERINEGNKYRRTIAFFHYGELNFPDLTG